MIAPILQKLTILDICHATEIASGGSNLKVTEGRGAGSHLFQEILMRLDLRRFYKACNPSQSLIQRNDAANPYYIDFSPVRGREIVEELKGSITQASPDEPTCQLFAAPAGSGKSIELTRLRAELEERGFHVVYCKATRYLNLGDVDLSDILLMIARQVSESLNKIKSDLQAGEMGELLKTQTEQLLPHAGGSGIGSSLLGGSGKIAPRSKDTLDLVWRLRMYLEPRTNSILKSINQELLEPAAVELKRLGKKGLVTVVDDLDRLENRRLPNGRLQPEYLFVDRGDQLRKLNCHVVYTVPLALVYSKELGKLTGKFGLEPQVLPMVPVRRRDGTHCEEGMALLRQVVLVRAFPEAPPELRLSLITEVFDSPETLDRLCRISGGYVRYLLGLIYRCLQKENPPIPRQCLETVIRERCHELARAIDDEQWELLRQIAADKTVSNETEYQILLRNMRVFEYRDERGRWFDVNPILAESQKFKTGPGHS